MKNKTEFICELKKQTNYSNEQCIRIINVLENNFLIGRNNKIKIINDLIENLNFSAEEANNVYNISSNIIVSEVKRKIFHPFKRKK